ncbi:MAG: polysaccharide biosynthesis C-terminal domain-containing protein, partial [Candidatus Omnitrophica bacterium]|nr:polysaccharide biosynthesis C-terminal domain-containing protein [Candidatus Omnitrophota bacterium]
WDIFISIAAINAYTTTRVFTMGLLTNNVITGFYSMAERIANVPQTFPLSSFSQAIFPRLSQMYHKNKLKAFRIMQRVQQITIVISAICLPFVFVFAHPIVKVICGGDYPQAVSALRVLLISVFFIHANAFRVQFLIVSGKTHIYSRIHVIMAIIGMPLIFLLIHSFSYMGAAASTVIIEASIFTITFFTVKKLAFHNPK